MRIYSPYGFVLQRCADESAPTKRQTSAGLTIIVTQIEGWATREDATRAFIYHEDPHLLYVT